MTYSDADYAGDDDTLRSTGAYVLKFGTGAVDWSSKLQSVVAQSTTEAEYLAAVNAGRDITWMRNLLSELGYDSLMRHRRSTWITTLLLRWPRIQSIMDA